MSAKHAINGKKNAHGKKHHKSDFDCDPLTIVRKLWATRQTETIDKEQNPDEYVKITIRELIVYLVFLVILCIISFGMVSPMFYYYTSILQGQFTGGFTGDQPYMTFEQITSIDDVWRYLKDPFIGALYTAWYNNSASGNRSDLDTSGYVLYENRLMGLPRLRQLKVKNNSCVVHDDFKEEIKFCYATYSEFIEDQDPFGKYYTNLEANNFTNDTAWIYQSAQQLNGRNVQALTNKYAGGGFVQLLSFDSDKTTAIINDLFDNLWITRSTRVLFIDFTLYNANINLFCQVRLTMEFPATGGVIPSFTFRTTKLIRYVTTFDYFIMACEIAYIVFIIYYAVEELIEIATLGKAYFRVLWNDLDILIILMSIVCIVFNIYSQFQVDSILDSLLANENQFADFEFICYWQTQFNNVIALAVFLAWMKIFKYTSFNKTMTQLTETIARCATDVAGFAIMFFIIFFAYAQLGYLIFGTQVKDFSTFSKAVYTLFRTILGDFDYQSIERAQRVLGPIFFLSYVFFVFFVLLNMFLAIINDTYGEVKAEIVKSEIELSCFIKRGYNKVLEKYNLKRDKIVDIQHALKMADLNGDKQIDFDEWRNDLRPKGYSDTEIEALFAKYDLDGDRVLNIEEQKRMYQDLANESEEIRKALKELEATSKEIEMHDKDEQELDGTTQSDLNQLTSRIDVVESSFDGIIMKIDTVLEKINALEKSKNGVLNQSSRGSTASGVLQLNEDKNRNSSSQSFC